MVHSSCSDTKNLLSELLSSASSDYQEFNLNRSNIATFQATGNNLAMEIVGQSPEQMLLLKLFSDNSKLQD